MYESGKIVIEIRQKNTGRLLLSLELRTLSGAKITHSSLPEASLSGVDLSGAQMMLTNMSGSDLTHAILAQTNLTDANMKDTDLTGLNCHVPDWRVPDTTAAAKRKELDDLLIDL